MMKQWMCCLLVLVMTGLLSPLQAQKLLTRTGHTWFESHTPLEDIKAHNHQTLSVLNLENGELAVSILIKGFQFEKALMQEHFNEKYMESDAYPKATFSGTISNFADIPTDKDGSYEVQATGTLTIHGVSKEIEALGTLKVVGANLTIDAEFEVEVADYDIKIPAVVRDNIAKTITIFTQIAYEPQTP